MLSPHPATVSAAGQHVSNTDGIVVRNVRRGRLLCLPGIDLSPCLTPPGSARHLIQWEAAKPLEFKLGEEGAVVPGFDLAAGSMSLGERASFSIPADLCYGIKVLPPRRAAPLLPAPRICLIYGLRYRCRRQGGDDTSERGSRV